MPSARPSLSRAGLAVPASNWRYICRESADIISPFISRAKATASSVLPEPVGPTMAIISAFLVRRRNDRHKELLWRSFLPAEMGHFLGFDAEPMELADGHASLGQLEAYAGFAVQMVLGHGIDLGLVFFADFSEGDSDIV